MGPVEELVIVGRRSGMPRHVFASVLRTDAAWYAGHPTGDDAQWVRNLAAAGIATVIDRTGAATRVRATRLERGPERDLAIGEALRQNRFPVSPIYRLGRGHIQAVGAYFRLEPLAER
jgi:hypothetical protein